MWYLTALQGLADSRHFSRTRIQPPLQPPHLSQLLFQVGLLCFKHHPFPLYFLGCSFSICVYLYQFLGALSTQSTLNSLFQGLGTLLVAWIWVKYLYDSLFEVINSQVRYLLLHPPISLIQSSLVYVCWEADSNSYLSYYHHYCKEIISIIACHMSCTCLFK